jgi:hypothetical protein
MRLTRLVVAASVAALVAAPVFAAAKNPAGSLSLANSKGADAQASDDTSTAHKGHHAGGHSGTVVLAGLGAAAVVGGAVALGTSGHHDNMPASN